jgi:AcrR family transcriptional regulator
MVLASKARITAPKPASTPQNEQRRLGRPPLVDDRRQQIIEAAFSAISEKGLEGLRMRGIADIAFVGHATIHHYFATKNDLLSAVLDYATRPLMDSGAHKEDPGERVRAHLARQIRLIEEQPRLLKVLREFDLRATRDSSIRKIIDSREAGWRSSLREIFEDGKRRQYWDQSFDVLGAVELLIAAIKGAGLHPVSAGAVLKGLEQILLPNGSARKRPAQTKARNSVLSGRSATKSDVKNSR